MRTLPAAVVARRAARVSTHAEILVWVSAKNRSTGAVETLGLWTGADHQDFTIGGVVRPYYGAGNVLQVPDIEASIGIEVRTYQIGLSAISPEVEMLIRGYDPKFAPVEIHRAEFDDAGNLLGEPERIFKGTVDGTPIITPAIGGEAVATLDVVSNARMLTRHPGVTKSDQVQRARAGDRFRRWGSIAAEVPIVWGGKKAKANVTVQAPARTPSTNGGSWGGKL